MQLDISDAYASLHFPQSPLPPFPHPRFAHDASRSDDDDNRQLRIHAQRRLPAHALRCAVRCGQHRLPDEDGCESGEYGGNYDYGWQGVSLSIFGFDASLVRWRGREDGTRVASWARSRGEPLINVELVGRMARGGRYHCPGHFFHCRAPEL